MKGKHLTEEERARIARFLNEGKHFFEIGELVGKDPTTIAKEVKRHRYVKKNETKPRHPCVGAEQCRRRNICSDRAGNCSKLCASCPWCIRHCKDYESHAGFDCKIDTHAPYVCNGCVRHMYGRCLRDQYIYGPIQAHKEYLTQLSQARIGADMTEGEMARIAELVVPLIKKGQPISHIYAGHKDEIGISARSFYRYVDQGYIGLENSDLRRIVRYRPRRKKYIPAPSPQRKIGHLYEDFLAYTETHPDIPVSEMDLVHGNKESGKALLTLMRRDINLMLLRLVENKEMDTVAAAFDGIEESIGTEAFGELFPLILTDNGSEFSDPTRYEVNKDGVVRTKLFYCKARHSEQKGALEKNHEFIRYILPRGKSFGKLDDSSVRNMMCHINSIARPKFGGMSPLELALGLVDEKVLAKLGLRLIPADEVCLTEALIKPDAVE